METHRLLILLLIMALLCSACIAISEEPPTPTLDEIIDAIVVTPTTTSTTLPPTPTDTPTPTPVPDLFYTGVILGTDWDPRRPERVQFGVRADVFVIYQFQVKQGVGVIDLDFISLPRDLWIPVPCSPLDPSLEGNDRINASYAYGQFECVKDTVELLGFDVNAPIFKIEMRGFISLINQMGGLYVTPTKTYSDKCGNLQGTEGGDYGWRTWTEGVEYWMDGNHALCYVRARGNSNDLDRNRRTLEVIVAMINQFPEKIFDSDNRMDAINELIGVWSWASAYVETTMGLGDIVNFGGYGIDLLNGDIPYLVHRMPLEAVEFWTTPIYGASVLVPKVDVEKWIQCEMNDHEGLRDCVEEWLLEVE